MKCKWYADFEDVCTNGDCPYRGDTCPTSEHPEVCKYAEKKPEIPQLSAEELVKALRICPNEECGCENCPYVHLSESGICCENYLRRKAADMLEKLAAEKDAKKAMSEAKNQRLIDSQSLLGNWSSGDREGAEKEEEQ